MASATDLSGKTVRFVYGGTPTEVEIISGSVSEQMDVTHYTPVNSNFKRSVVHGKLATISITGALLTSALPFSALAAGTALSTVAVEPDRASGSTEWAFPDAVVGEMAHEFDTSTHQIFRITLYSDGSYTLPS